MAYRLRLKDKSLEKALRRIGREQVDKALHSIRDDSDPSRSVHEVRKRSKNIRGLLRLVRPGFSKFKKENACFRDIARRLTGLRDAKVMLDTFDGLAEAEVSHGDRHGVSAVRRRLTLESTLLLEEVNVRRLMARTEKDLADARDRIRDWEVEGECWQVIGPAVAATHERARLVSEIAFAEQGSTSLHELRKWLRYHWCHTRLLRAIWPEEMKLRADMAWQLVVDLGNRHDLAIFETRIERDPGAFGSRRNVDRILTLARHRGTLLEDRSRTLAGRLFAESGEALAERWHGLWNVWRDRVDETKD